ncbi:MAG: hypothetical protein J1F33_03085 [Clostridiales bacterium]|nr:hypothetical protein [Clostridiales bacterium]
MSLIDEINYKLKSIREYNTSFDFSIVPRKFHHDNMMRLYLSFFKNENKRDNQREGKWEIEVSVSQINDAWQNGELNSLVFLKNCTASLLKKFHVNNLFGNTLEKYDVEYDNEVSIPTVINPVFNSYTELFNSGFRRANTIIFNDEPKMGKTTFIKYFCNDLLVKQNSPKIWRLDFNNGNDAIILDFLTKLYSQNLQDQNNYLIIDNLECCGYTKGGYIADFFIDFVNILKLNGTSIKLIIIQDNNKKCYIGSADPNKKVFVPDKTLSFEIQSKNLEESLLEIHYKRIANDVLGFLNNEQVDLRIKTYFINIIFFARYGVNLRINKRNSLDKKDILTIEKFIRGIKLMSSGEIISFPIPVCNKILDQFCDIIKEILVKFQSILIDADNNFNANILECYYKYLSTNSLPLYMTDFYSILKMSGKRNDNINNFFAILKKAEDANKFITSAILDETKTDRTRFFDYHLGAILFAGETLSTYADQNWETLKAWIELHEHIKKTFYIEGQEIYIRHGRERYDNTIRDFKTDDSRPPLNCISNQMKLHDEVLGQCAFSTYTELPKSDVDNIWSHENIEGLFGFYLSPIQCVKKSKNGNEKIDIDRFYRTYILALLFEFEVMAPEEQRDINRIEKLWSKIKINCIKSEKFNCRFFYPARVPWVTARMALAMSACFKNYGNHHICDEIEPLIKDIGEYLATSSIKFTRDDKTYRFWSSGTGLWNSTLETTIICAFALKEFAYAEYKNIVEEGINFINLFKDNWFKGNMIADGIWAYQTTEKIMPTNVFERIKSFVSMTENVDFTYHGNDKNDKSLGLSHIAKTLIDIVKEFIEVKPNLLILPDAINENDDKIDLEEHIGIEKDVIDLAIQIVVEWVNDNNSSDNRAKLLEPEFISLINEFEPSYGATEEARDRLQKAQAFLRTVKNNEYEVNSQQTVEFKRLLASLAQKIGRGERLKDK